MTGESGALTGTTIGVVGAGMMGSALAYTCARAGADVVLVARTLEGARRGRAYADRREMRALQAGTTDTAVSQALLARITPTERVSDLAPASLVVEAVAENVAAKQQVLQSVEAVTDPGTFLASTTSTLPITTLASTLARPENFVGMHFFSPVDRMALVETITGTRTSETTLAASLTYSRKLGKTPIVVRDSRGFFTSRVMQPYLDEAMVAVGEGIDPVLVERAALEAGYPVPPLQLLDEITLTLNRAVQRENRAAVGTAGGAWRASGADRVRDRMIDEHGRVGRSVGRGFYEYDTDGTRIGLWPGLRDVFGTTRSIPVDDMRDRLLFVEVIEALRCLDEGVIGSEADADTGSVLGIGFPAHTGGVVSFRRSYTGGAEGFTARARELADRYGHRFLPPEQSSEAHDQPEYP
ncbi:MULTISPECIES: 3-hydroxyacyl-CoA dehydrogenase family protein [Rhodococcus]|uniref:3-hydroxyacyl-CoA dehydrogenase family protein n=1 Tax=Rhodococcus TaxID=1827 RepID=UPI0002D21B90|nr:MULTISPECIES: 3-hydroxyacyl-CoA dehydrogenase family protein [Rhodococcus]KDE14951.1 3-hydroxyacyl-CoA dehydrogenase [Rhodococcus aetherivorans]QIX49190.1 3-hydroxyacyl-CoA dehydrogenase family protein [Rhodococcus sp. DMU1]CCW11623.1 Enoyl-CoA hydratase [isoleucine degradation] / 3-hydroxyacyl-CoA dehydrogenase / 3-hydroxybutyryl-CoA epimerase [Rhodococcus aetherivorans]